MIGNDQETPAVFSDAGYERKIILLLALGFGFVGLDRWLVTPLAPAIMHDLKLNYQDLGNLTAAVGLSWGLFAIIMGRLADRVGRRIIILPAIVAFSLLSGVSGLAGGFMSLFIARMLMGVAEGAYCPASYAAALDASPSERRGVNLGVIQGAFALFGLALGPIIATQLVAVLHSWRLVFVLVAIPGLILAVVLARVLRDPPRRTQIAAGHKPKWRDVFASRNMRIVIPTIFASMSGIFVLGSMAPLFLTDVVGLNLTSMGMVMSGLGLGGFVGQIMLGAISDVVGRKPTLFLAFATGCLSLVALALAVRSPAGLFVMLFIAAFCCCGANALLAGPIPGEAVPPELMSSAMGLAVGLGEIFGGGIAPSLAGTAALQFGLLATIMGVAAVLAAGAMSSLLLKETAPRKMQMKSPKDNDLLRETV